MFEHIDKKKNIPKKQILEKGTISAHRAGRPKAPNMEPVTVRLDRAFHREVKVYAKKIGMGKSALIAASLKTFMENKHRKYRLLEVE